MKLRLILALTMTIFILSCATTHKTDVAPSVNFNKFSFEGNRYFKTYDFNKFVITDSDRKLTDYRVTREFRYEILQSSPLGGAFLKRTVGSIEGATFENKEMQGSFSANVKDGITRFKENSIFSKNDLNKELNKIEYFRVDSSGRLIASGTGPAPNNPLSITDWGAVNGFKVPSYAGKPVLQAAFGFVMPDISTPFTVNSTWKGKYYQAINGYGLIMNTSSKVGGTTDQNIQFSTFGDSNYEVLGDGITVHSARYFSQSVFNTAVGFYANHSAEFAVEFTLKDGRRQKFFTKYITNNTRAKTIPLKSR